MSAADWQAIGSMLSAVAAIVGFIFIIINIYVLNHTLRSNINGNLLQQSVEILKYIANNPYLYDYLYNQKSLTDTDQYKVEVLCLCEMVENYCDLVLDTCKDLKPQDRVRWKYFVENTLQSIPELKTFIHKYHPWYSDNLTKLL